MPKSEIPLLRRPICRLTSERLVRPTSLIRRGLRLIVLEDEGQLPDPDEPDADDDDGPQDPDDAEEDVAPAMMDEDELPEDEPEEEPE